MPRSYVRGCKNASTYLRGAFNQKTAFHPNTIRRATLGGSLRALNVDERGLVAGRAYLFEEEELERWARVFLGVPNHV